MRNELPSRYSRLWPLKKIIVVVLLFCNASLLNAQSSNGNAASSFKSANSNVLTMGSPASAGMSAERLSRIDSLVQDYVDKKWIAGATVLVARNGKIVYYKGLGYDDVDRKTPMKKDAICRI